MFSEEETQSYHLLGLINLTRQSAEFVFLVHFATRNDRQCRYKRNTGERSWNHCCSGKAMSITYYECVFAALVIRHAKRMRRIKLSSVACLALPFFSHRVIKDTIFGRSVLNTQFVFWLSLQILLEIFSFQEECREM